MNVKMVNKKIQITLTERGSENLTQCLSDFLDGIRLTKMNTAGNNVFKLLLLIINVDRTL